MFPDGLQFRAPLWARFGPGHFQILECIENDAGNDEPGILFAVCGNDVPGRVMRAGCVQACLIGLHIILPVFPLVNVGKAEFPVLVRFIDACEESFSLLLLREVKEYLHDSRSVPVQMFFHLHDGAIPPFPDGLLVA